LGFLVLMAEFGRQPSMERAQGQRLRRERWVEIMRVARWRKSSKLYRDSTDASTEGAREPGKVTLKPRPKWVIPANYSESSENFRSAMGSVSCSDRNDTDNCGIKSLKTAAFCEWGACPNCHRSGTSRRPCSNWWGGRWRPISAGIWPRRKRFGRPAARLPARAAAPA
jgi:hypothetical protein